MNADDAYAVATNGEITYTLREDHMADAPGGPQQFVIPLVDGSLPGEFGRVGLLDVFNAGPDNEEDGTLGGGQTIRLNTFDGTTTLGGTITEQLDGGGNLIGLLYTPPADMNSVINPLPDSFTYSVIDDGETWTLGTGLEDDVLVTTNTVFFVLNPINDAPQFTAVPSAVDGSGNIQSTIEVLEQDDETQEVRIQWANGIRQGPGTATDELASQSVQFDVTPIAGNSSGLFTAPPTISPSGLLEFTPSTDAVGTAVFVVAAFDQSNSVPANPADVDRSIPVTLTIHVRPVNDAPIIDSDVLGREEIHTVDDAYFVDSQGQITYVLREDNAPPSASGPQPYVLNLQDNSGPTSYSPIGLLDVFNAGPDNEEDGTLGGDQTLRISSFEAQTSLGGTIDAEQDVNGNITRLLYTPPEDVNSTFSQPDSFSYTVSDDGGTWQIGNGLQSDARSTSNTVFFILTAVNDAPLFEAPISSFTALEDSPELRFTNYANNILAGPPSAIDEIDIVSGQGIEFLVMPIDAANTALATQLFGSNQPGVTTDGTLFFTPAADQYGTVEFDVVLQDVGRDEPTRGDVNRTSPVRLTITIQPQNDAPVFANDDPVAFTLEEDGSLLIPLRAQPGEAQGLLDKFLVGPDNESANITPGGNQSLQLATPIPASTPAGGTLTPVTIGGESFLRYRPKTDFNGVDSFVYGVIDNGQSVDLTGFVSDDFRKAFFTVDLAVNAINDRPQFAGAGNVSTPEDAGEADPAVPPAEVGLTVVPEWATNIQAGTAGATDESDLQTVSFVITPTDAVLARTVFATDVDGNLLVSADEAGTLRFQTLPDANGDVEFTVFAVDDGDPAGGLNTSTSKTFTISVDAVNDPPTFVPGDSLIREDEDSGSYSQPWATSILAGPADEVAAGQSVRFEVTIDPADAGLFQVAPTISDDGTLRFTPAADANGTAVVTVVALDSLDLAAEPVTLTIEITPQVDRPVAAADEFEVDEDNPRTLLASELLANDSDADLPDDELTIVLPSGVTFSGATVSLDADNNVVYDPSQAIALQALAPGQETTDTFTYFLTDSFGETSEEVTVSLVVSGINDAPRLFPDNPDVSSTGATILRPLDNDVDIDGTIDPTSLEITLRPSFGSVEVRNDGTILYTSFAGFRGNDLIRYTVADNLGLRSIDGQINITSNSAPIAEDDRTGTFRDEAVDISVVFNDFDPDANGSIDADSVVIVTAPQNGTAIALPGGLVRYIPNDGFVGNDVFTYRVSDNLGRSSEPATVRVQVSASRLQNPVDNADVDNDGNISAVDALLVIFYLNRNRPTDLNMAGTWQDDVDYSRGDVVQFEGRSWLANEEVPVGVEPTLDSDWIRMTPPFYDVDGNQRIEPFDALRVINALNRRARDSRGEVAGEAAPSIDRRDSAPTEVVIDQAHTLLRPAASKVIGTATNADSAYVGEQDWLELLALDKSAVEEDTELDSDKLWRSFE